jgi:diguanylate cyclase (GGDEF)-like protein
MVGKKVEILGANIDDVEFSILNKDFEIGIFRSTANEEGLLLYVNKILKKKLGLDPASEILYKKLVDLYYNPSDWLTHLKCIKQEKECLFKKVAFKAFDGKPVYFNVYFILFEPSIYGIVRSPQNIIEENYFKEDEIKKDNAENGDTILIDLDKKQKINSTFVKESVEAKKEEFAEENSSLNVIITDEEKESLFSIGTSKNDGDDFQENNENENTQENVGNIFDNETFQNAPFAIMVQKENNNNNIFYNKKLKEIFNIKEKTIGYYSLFVNYILPNIDGCEDSNTDTEECIKKLINALSTESENAFNVRLKNQETYEYRVYPIRIYTDQGSKIYRRVFYLFEATKETDNLEYLKTLSFQDALTGLDNRRSFESFLSKSIEASKRYKKPFSLIMFDIDNFKQINDTYGHPKGDEILKEISLLVKSNIRKSDIIARYGGEEFMILCQETKIPQAVYLAEKIRTLIQNHKFSINKLVTCSFGVVEHKEYESMSELIARVDNLLYKAKRNGKNRVEMEIYNTKKPESSDAGDYAKQPPNL